MNIKVKTVSANEVAVSFGEKTEQYKWSPGMKFSEENALELACLLDMPARKVKELYNKVNYATIGVAGFS